MQSLREKAQFNKARIIGLFIFLVIAFLFSCCSSPTQVASRKFYKALNTDVQTVYNACGTIAPPLAAKHTYLKTGAVKMQPNSVVINCDTVRDGVFYPVPVTVDCPPSIYRVDTFYDVSVVINNAKEIAQGLRIEDFVKEVTRLETQRQYWRNTAIVSILILIIVFTLKAIL